MYNWAWFHPPRKNLYPQKVSFLLKTPFSHTKMGFLYLNPLSLLVPHIYGLQSPLIGHCNLQIWTPTSVLVPRFLPPHFPIDEIPSGISSMGKNKTPVTQSLTTQNGWLMAHFKAMGISFHQKKLEFYGGGTNRVFCRYFIDLTRSKGRKLSTIGTFSPQITQLPLKFNFLFSF